MFEVKQQSVKSRLKIKLRFFSLLSVTVIIAIFFYFLWVQFRNQLPNLHGWTSTDVLTFAQDNDIHITFEFSYSNKVAPSLVSGQSVNPGTQITDDMIVVVEISKGIQVR